MYQRRSRDSQRHDNTAGDRNRRSYRKRKKNYLPAIICIILAVLLIVIVFVLMSKDDKKPYEKVEESTAVTETATAPSGESNAVIPTSEVNTVAPTDNNTEETTAKAEQSDTGLPDESTDLSSWNLKLVNITSEKLSADYVPPLGLVDGYYVREDIVEPTEKLIEAAKADGIKLFIISGYRSYQTQNELFNNRVAMYEDEGMSHDEAYKKASMVNAVPGTSEHQLGLAIDFNSLDQSFGETAEGKWLYNNAWKYGFIFRYPEESVGITGIMYEPWHYRYVGVNNAKVMHDKGMTLEEYIDYLNKN